MTENKEKKKRQGWKQNPEAVQENILEAALEEFAERGFAGARINLIADKTDTSKRMIYYYFGDKEGLYRRVIEKTYTDTRQGELALELDLSKPQEALRKLITFTFNHHRKHSDFIRLVMIENIHQGRHLGEKQHFADINAPAIQRVKEIYSAGVEQGVFRRGLSAEQLHWQISAMCFFNVSNQATFAAAFGDQLFTPTGQKELCQTIEDTVLTFLLHEPDRLLK